MQPTSTPTDTPELDLALPTQAAVKAPAETAHGPVHCLNCGHGVPDRYCGQCGQDAHHTHRLTMADMLHDIPHSIWHVDKGILYTLKTMVFRPGPTIREYLAGKRVHHFRPLSLLFLVTGVYALLSSVLHIDMVPPRDPNMPEAVWQMQKSGLTFFAKYMSWFYLAMVPVIAIFVRLFLRRGGFNYAECLIIVAFITAITNFLALLYLPVMYAYSGTHLVQTASLIFSVVLLSYSAWAYGSLLTHTTLGFFGRLWRGFFGYTMGFVACIFIMLVAGFTLNWSSIKQSRLQEAQKLKAQSQQQATPPKPATPQP